MILLNGKEVNLGLFPNGEHYADINSNVMLLMNKKENVIEMRFRDDTDILFLSYLKQYLDDVMPYKPCDLYMPYVPYSRMDRLEENRLFTLKYLTKIINGLNFRRVLIMEPHSDVTSGLLDRVIVINEAATLAKMAMMDALGVEGMAWLGDYDYGHCGCSLSDLYKKAESQGVYFVLPDFGAEKRYKKQINYSKMLVCSKERNFNKGKIRSTIVHDVEKAQDCKIAIIVDDLCSKGGTFIGVADSLRRSIKGIEKIYLCVPHCENNIFDGFVLSGDSIDMVYTTNSMLNVLANSADYLLYQNKLKIFDMSNIYTDFFNTHIFYKMYT